MTKLTQPTGARRPEAERRRVTGQRPQHLVVTGRVSLESSLHRPLVFRVRVLGVERSRGL